MSSKQKVASFELTDMNQKKTYEQIINTYQVIREEFAYMRDGTPKVTVWYVKEEED